MNLIRLNAIASEIIEERRRQYDKFGRQALDRTRFGHILMEEVGEVSQAILQERPIGEVRKELIQVAAVAMQWVEEIDHYTTAVEGGTDLPYPNFIFEGRKL